MNNIQNPNAPYAVLRVDKRKAKARGAIAASSAHQLRQRPTPNANPEGHAPIILHLAGGETPYQAACAMLEGVNRRNKTTVICREIVVSASPSYFRPGREEIGGLFDQQRMQAWARSTLAWAKRQWPDQLASVVLHLDEQTPHLHMLVVPRILTSSGWNLNSKKLFDRERLRELQTSYAEALAPLGIRRGEPGSRATHSEASQFYGAAKRLDKPINRPKPPAAPKPPTPPTGAIKRALEPLAEIFGIETAYSLMKRSYQAARRAWVDQMHEHRTHEKAAWEKLQAAAAIAPLKRRERDTRGVATPKQKLGHAVKPKLSGPKL